jgi:hypothetical protein
MNKFPNPKMPSWLEYGLLVAFQTKNLDNIKGYQKLWEDMQNDK